MHSSRPAAVLAAALLLSLLCAPDGPAQQGPRPGAGPRATTRTDRVPDPTQSPENLKAQATEILQGVIEGLLEGDYSLYTSRFSDNMKKGVSREAFLDLQKNLQKKLGKFKSMEYLGFYVQYGNVVTLFKARFSKEREDVLIKLVLDVKKSAPVVAGLWLDAPSLGN